MSLSLYIMLSKWGDQELFTSFHYKMFSYDFTHTSMSTLCWKNDIIYAIDTVHAIYRYNYAFMYL